MNAAIAENEGSVCGYEANGGFLLGSSLELYDRKLLALQTRDAILPIIATLVASRPGKLRDILTTLPAQVTFSDRLQDFTTDERDALTEWFLPKDEVSRNARLTQYFSAVAESDLLLLNVIDGVPYVIRQRGVTHFRSSGNAPELQCHTEAEDIVTAQRINKSALEIVRTNFGNR